MGVLAAYEVYLGIVAIATVALRIRFYHASMRFVWEMRREHPALYRTARNHAVEVLVVPAAVAALVTLVLLGAHAYVLHVAHGSDDLSVAELLAEPGFAGVVFVLAAAVLGADAWNLYFFRDHERPRRRTVHAMLERLLRTPLRSAVVHGVRWWNRRTLLKAELKLNPWFNAWGYRMGLRAALAVSLWIAIGALS